MTFTLTSEQSAIVEFPNLNPKSNLAVIARAGAAKTTTLVELAKTLPNKRILCIAFNRDIVTELKQKMPPNCTTLTMHSLGSKAWGQYLGKCPKVDTKGQKIYRLLSAAINALEPEDQEEAYEVFAETLDIIKKGKNAGWIPERSSAGFKPLLSDDEFFDNLPLEPSPLQIELVRVVSEKSFKIACTSEIDFDDMVLCPGIAPVSFPRFDLTLVDEAQDMSILNHVILKKLVRKSRIYAVGDPLQAIYGFRGADTKSMENLIKMFSMETLHLTISFRCAVKITESVHWRAPDMRSPEWAKPGLVQTKPSWTTDEILDGDAVICRNNAQLFRLTLELIRARRFPEFRGRNILKPIAKKMQKFGPKHLTRVNLIKEISHWRDRELDRARKEAETQIHDHAEIMEILAEETSTLGEALTLAQDIENRTGRIVLTTGHKSKGLEFDRVFFLNADLINPDYEQDLNLKYVIQTRAKEELYFIHMDDFIRMT